MKAFILNKKFNLVFSLRWGSRESKILSFITEDALLGKVQEIGTAAIKTKLAPTQIEQ